MLRFTIVVFLLISTYPLFSQPITARSGEHRGFSRIVVYLEPSQAWEGVRLGDELIITIPGNDEGFSTGSVFERIARDRISRIESSKSQLRIFLACDCSSEFYHRDDGLLVVDVIDKPEADAVNSAVNLADLEAGYSSDGIRNGTRATPWFKLDQRPYIIFDLPTSESGDRLVGEYLLHPSQEKESVSQGTDQLVFNVLDRQARIYDAGRDGRIEVRSAGIESCGRNYDLAASNWVFGRDFSEDLRSVRGDLLGEFDRIDQGKLVKLVKLHLFHGLIDEALLISESLDLSGEENRFVSDVVRILVGDSGALAGRILECGRESDFWKVLAANDLKSPDLAEQQSLLSILDSLPVGLQIVVAPKLLYLLSADGYRTSANAVVNQIERKVLNSNPVVLIGAEGGEIFGLDQLEAYAVARSNSPQSPEAIFAYFQFETGLGLAKDREIMSLASTYLDQLSGTHIGTSLLNALFHQYLKLGWLTESVGLFSEYSSNLASFDYQLVLDFLELAWDAPADHYFVSSIWVLLNDPYLSNFDIEVVLSLYEKLSDIGHPGIAKALITSEFLSADTKNSLASSYQPEEAIEMHSLQSDGSAISASAPSDFGKLMASDGPATWDAAATPAEASPLSRASTRLLSARRLRMAIIESMRKANPVSGSNG